MNEVWKTINGYEDYQISNLGRVKSLCKNKPIMLKAGRAKSGYFTVCLHKNKQPLTHNIHRLIAEHFIPNPENKKYVNHIDGNKENSTLSNLEWVTHAENMQHAYDTGLMKKRKCICVETNEIFQSIRDAEIKYNLNNSHITACCKGNRKTHGGFHWQYVMC